jgi:hypothetical protein
MPCETHEALGEAEIQLYRNGDRAKPVWNSASTCATIRAAPSAFTAQASSHPACC